VASKASSCKANAQFSGTSYFFVKKTPIGQKGKFLVTASCAFSLGRYSYWLVDEREKRHTTKDTGCLLVLILHVSEARERKEG